MTSSRFGYATQTFSRHLDRLAGLRVQRNEHDFQLAGDLPVGAK